MIKYKTIFLVDDDEDDQMLFHDAVREIDASIHCSVANNGIQALNKLNMEGFVPDLMFVDLNMPLMNGFEFLLEVGRLEHISQVPIVIFTTSASPEQAHRTFELGASAFLTKPPSFNLLRTKLSNILSSDLELNKKKFQFSEYVF